MQTPFYRAKYAFSDELYSLCNHINYELMLSKERGGGWLDGIEDLQRSMEKVKAWKQSINDCKTADELRAVMERAQKIVEDDMGDQGAARIVTLCEYCGVFDQRDWCD